MHVTALSYLVPSLEGLGPSEIGKYDSEAGAVKLSKAKAANISLTGITFFQLTYVKRKMIYVKISKIMIIKCLVCKRGEKQLRLVFPRLSGKVSWCH